MHTTLKKFPLFCFLLLLSCKLNAQVFLGDNELDYANPKEYEIGGITVAGAQVLDEGVLINLSGLKVGTKITIPGDKISKAIQNLWKQGLFADVKIVASKINGNTIFLEIKVQEKPRLSRFSFKGVKKSEADKLREEIQLVRGKPVTENLKTTTLTRIKKYFTEKGFSNVEVTITEKVDSTLMNSVMLTIVVDKNQKIKINRIIFRGNKAISSVQLRGSLKDTKEKNRFDVFSDLTNKLTHIDSLKRINWSNTFLTLFSPSKMYSYVSDRTRLAIFTTSKFIDATYQTDKHAISERYTALGYRDAKIVKDTIYKTDKNSINIEITINEGRKYYFRNITWIGNTKHTTQELVSILGIKKGDVFDQSVLDSRLFMNPNGRDVSSLYLDDGYLFFQVTPVEASVESDSIDLEMHIYEGKQAVINKVTISGNTKTNDRVIMREIRTRPGQLFSRSDIIRSQRELAQLGFFNAEKLNVTPKPNPAEGTVDIEYTVEEKPSDQIELSGGYGAGQLVGTLGVSFNNFAARNFFKKETWTPLPSGDGQRLSLRAQTNGVYYQSYNASFTEPWLGGKKPNSLSVSIFHSVQTNGIAKGEDGRQSITITGTSVGLGKRLKFPDDYFTVYWDASYQYYVLNRYSNFVFNDGYANNFNLGMTISRNSIDQPLFPRNGSQFSFVMHATPPYSLFAPDKNYAQMENQDKYKFIEYYKWKFTASWFSKIVGDLVLNTRIKYGFLGHYNEKLGASPFERFYVGGSGLSGFSLDGREIIALRGYNDNALTPQGITSSGAYNYIGGTVFNKYTFELRYPISLNPQATIYALGFAEAGDSWLKFKEFSPFEVKRSAGVGIRVFLPMFGQLGLDYGFPFDKLNPQDPLQGQFHFSIGQSIE